MRISHDIAAVYGGGSGGPGMSGDEVEAGMRAKAEEFAVGGNRVYLPLAD
jgi:hypothetical protein